VTERRKEREKKIMKERKTEKWRERKIWRDREIEGKRYEKTDSWLDIFMERISSSEIVKWRDGKTLKLRGRPIKRPTGKETDRWRDRGASKH
jgi:hypothetical protein